MKYHPHLPYLLNEANMTEYRFEFVRITASVPKAYDRVVSHVEAKEMMSSGTNKEQNRTTTLCGNPKQLVPAGS